MADRRELIPTALYGQHKGFYNDEDFSKALLNIDYTEFFEYPFDDDMFPYDSAYPLLRGSCNHFAVALHNVLGYNAYIIQEKDRKSSFHAFCQIFKDRTLYYVDARGITTSFNEFMSVAREFVHDEFIIRPLEETDIAEWKEEEYFDEAMAFAKAVIKKYKECYTLQDGV